MHGELDWYRDRVRLRVSESSYNLMMEVTIEQNPLAHWWADDKYINIKKYKNKNKIYRPISPLYFSTAALNSPQTMVTGKVTPSCELLSRCAMA